MRKAIRLIVLAAAAVVFIVSCVNLFQIFSEYRKGEMEYTEIQEYAVLPETEEAVSYTHLDVYKRQGQRTGRGPPDDGRQSLR